MPELDGKIKSILADLDILIRRKAELMERGEPVTRVNVDINTLMGALRVLEARQNG